MPHEIIDQISLDESPFDCVLLILLRCVCRQRHGRGLRAALLCGWCRGGRRRGCEREGACGGGEGSWRRPVGAAIRRVAARARPLSLLATPGRRRLARFQFGRGGRGRRQRHGTIQYSTVQPRREFLTICFSTVPKCRFRPNFEGNIWDFNTNMETDYPWSAAAAPTSSWHAVHG